MSSGTAQEPASSDQAAASEQATEEPEDQGKQKSFGVWGSVPAGIRLLGASAFSGYSSSALGQLGAFNPLGKELPGVVNIGGSASISLANKGKVNKLSLVYTPTYFARLRYQEWHTVEHNASLNANRRWSARWNTTFSLNGGTNNTEQLQFAPNPFEEVPGFFTSLPDVTAGLLSGTVANSQVAGILTGTPAQVSPAQPIIFSNRFLSVNAGTSTSYMHSTRFSVHFGVGASRHQPLSTGLDEEGPQTGLLAHSTNGHVNVGFSYSLSPRTSFGADASASRTFSGGLQSALNSSVNGSFRRNMTKRLFLSLTGGYGKVYLLGDKLLSEGHQTFLGGGSIGYKNLAHNFAAGYNRSIGDAYGLGSQTTSSVNGSWHWNRPGWRWGLRASGSHQRFQGGLAAGTEAWTVQAGLVRALTRRVGLTLSYSYLNNETPTLPDPAAGSIPSPFANIAVHAVRLTVSWSAGAAAQ